MKKKAKAKRECPAPSSPKGKHTFSPDVQRDATGRTINCEHCGKAALAPERIRVIRQLYR